MPRRKDISNDLREAAHLSGKGYKAISKLFGVHHFTAKKIIHMWKTFKIFPGVVVPASSPQGQKPKNYISDSTGSTVSMLNVKVHDSTIRKRLNKYGLFGRVANLNKLKQRWKEERTKIPPQPCEPQPRQLITSYRKPLLQLIAAKGGSSSCWIMWFT